MSMGQGRDIRLADEAATARLGAAIGAVLRPGDAVCLSGPLGAGKSTLARALIRSLTTPDEEVPSPTFTLVQFYAAVGAGGEGLSLAHFDLYRLASPDEAYEIGLDEALEDGAVLIEWPERLQDALPPDRLDVVLTPESGGGDEKRRARLTPHGGFVGRGIEFGS